MLVLIGLLFLSWLIALYYESGALKRFVDELRAYWRAMGVPARVLAVTMLALCTCDAGSKGTNPIARVMRVLFYHADDIWPLQEASRTVADAQELTAQAEDAIVSATNSAAHATAFAATNEIVSLSFDWHAPDRLPAHDRQNVLAHTVWVTPTNINGVLYEDHFVAFNAAAATNPAVILIEYAGRDASNNIVRFSSKTVTNSYPDTVVLNLQSGSHTCYWFRCAVPQAFISGCVRDWNGEALFGSPEGSDKGFDLLGTLIIDDGNNVWVGATTNMVFGSVTNTVRNGFLTED